MSDPVHDKVEDAAREILAAEDQLEKALREIRIAPRAEKTTISALLEAAFLKLKAARTRVLELEKLLEGRTDD
ncbi:MAG TPA: hypothetical protein VIF15_10140 [Polyangiaceae bacterium]|jgi:hypothetical protein